MSEIIEPKLDELLKNEAIFKEFRQKVDAENTKAIKTWQANHLQEEVNKALEAKMEEIQKKKDKTPEELRAEKNELEIKKLREQIEQTNKEKKMYEARAKAQKEITELGIPDSILDFVITDDDDKNANNIGAIKELFDAYAHKIKQDIIVGNNVKIPGKTAVSSELKPPADDAPQEEWRDYLLKKKNLN